MRLLQPDGEVVRRSRCAARNQPAFLVGLAARRLGRFPADDTITSTRVTAGLRATVIAPEAHVPSNGSVKTDHHLALPVLPLLVLPLTSRISRTGLPLGFHVGDGACALAGCKWLTFGEGEQAMADTGRVTRSGLFAGWPGMDAARFSGMRETNSVQNHEVQWLLAVVKIIFGAVLLW